MSFFETSLIALDVGSSAIKMLEFTRKKSTVHLKNYGMEPLSQGVIEDGVIVDPELLKSTIMKLSKRLRVKGRRTALSLAGSGVLIKRIAVSVGADTTIDDQIPYHAEQAFQVDPAGLYFDHVVLQVANPRAKEIDILLVGARRELVEQYVTCVKNAGMKLGVIESDAISLANAFEANYGQMPGLIALINIGAAHTQISFVSDGAFVFCRDVPIGGNSYTKRIMEGMKLTFENAESVKISASFSDLDSPTNQEIKTFIAEVNETLVTELVGTYEYFTRTLDPSQRQALKFIFISGGASRTIGLDSAIAASLQAPVGPLNPFQQIEIDDSKFELGQIASISSMLGVAAGLGLRRINDKES
ncbi:MAG: type IV pilus assembly protein PilM [Proteobacteria bacterium]|nr:type IV pilus assembly protein PilM [Pseudomonadota bacterium]